MTRNLENEESLLLDQSTLSMLTHKLNLDPYSNIENIRSNNPNRLIIAQLNTNSLWNKFDSLVEILHSKVDILSISETKIDSSCQFKIGYAIYVREDIPSTLLNTESFIESFCIETFSLYIKST